MSGPAFPPSRPVGEVRSRRATAPLSDAAGLGPVHLRVSDLARSARFWVEVVGLEAIADGDGLDLGVEGRTLVVLHGGARFAYPAARVGLFHVALDVPHRLTLAQVARRLRDAGHPCGGQDHLVSESIYCADPDGNGLELCYPTPDRAQVHIVAGQPYFRTPDGTPLSGLQAIDIGRLLDETASSSLHVGSLPAGTTVGHVHLRSNSPEASMLFYTETIGFRPQIASAAFGMFDAGTRARPHMIALNTWAGRHLPRTTRDSAGLSAFTIEVPVDELDAMRDRLAGTAMEYRGGTSLAFDDPDGNRLHLRAHADPAR